MYFKIKLINISIMILSFIITGCGKNSTNRYTFMPNNGGIATCSNYTIQYAESVQSDIANTDINTLITLREGDISGESIPYKAIINTVDNTIVVTPIKKLKSKSVVYLQISQLTDSYSTIIPSRSIKFLSADVDIPIVVFDPSDKDTDIDKNSTITITFNEPIINIDGSEIDASNINSLINLQNKFQTVDYDFTATITEDKKIITIIPSKEFRPLETITLTFKSVKDIANNPTKKQTIQFEIISQSSNGIDFTFTDANNYPLSNAKNISIDTDLKIKSTKIINVTDIESYIKLKYTNSIGPDIPFDAQLNDDKRIINITPKNPLNSGELIYLCISSINSISQKSEINFTTEGNRIPFELTFLATKMNDTNTTIETDTNFKLLFTRRIRNRNDDSEITNENVKSLINLNQEGTDIEFNATISADKKIITIDPINNLVSDKNVTLSLMSIVEDYSNNPHYQKSITYNVSSVNMSAPLVSIKVNDNQSNTNSQLIIDFNKPIFDIYCNNITNENVATLITLRNNDINGTDINFIAIINDTKTRITINPSVDFSSEQTVFLSIDIVQDIFYNRTIKQSKRLTIKKIEDSTTVHISPYNNSYHISPDTNFTINYSRRIKNFDQSDINSSNVSSLIILKNNNAEGEDINFTATIDLDKKIIIVNPDNNFTSEQMVYLKIKKVRDINNRQIISQDIHITVKDTLAPTETFNPQNQATNVPLDSNFTITYSEPVKNINNRRFFSNHLRTLITLKKDNSNGDDISFVPSIDINRRVITINPTQDLASGQTIYLGISSLKDDNNNQTEPKHIIFQTNSLSTNITYQPNNNETISADDNIIITFSNPIKDKYGTDMSSILQDGIKIMNDDDFIEFTATISDDQKVITINPNQRLDENKTFTYFLDSPIQDHYGNDINTTRLADNGINFNTNSTIITSNSITSDALTPVQLNINNNNIDIQFNKRIFKNENKNINIYTTVSGVQKTLKGFNTDTSIDINNNEATLHLGENTHLKYGAKHYIKIDTDAFVDENNNSYSSIDNDDSEILSFTIQSGTGPCSLDQLDNCDLDENIQE